MLTAAKVDIEIVNNATFQDAFMFGTAGDTSWSFSGQTFKMEIKANKFDTTPILTLNSGTTIIVDDVVQRILHFNVPDATIQASLPIAEYQYDLVMIDGSTPAIRVPLMSGEIKVRQGVTEN